jgi:two-component system NtrC family sensor kinase
LSLRVKMVIGIGCIVLLVILEYAGVAWRAQTEEWRSLAAAGADLTAETTSRAISIAMEQGKSAETQQILVRIGRDQRVSAIRILDANGTILLSSDPEEVGRTLGREERPASWTSPGPVWSDRGRSVSVFRSIPNGPECYDCHSRDRESLGLLSVRFSPLPKDPQLASRMRLMALTAAGGLVAASLLIAVLFTLLVGRRIDGLMRTMHRVESGDLSASIPVDGNDELDRLGRSFNAMVARLAEEKRLRDVLHAEEMRKAAQMAALGKMAAVGTITSGIAHELNNPLNNISLTTEALMEDFASISDETRWKLLQDVYFEVERASEIVRSLLDFTREEAPEMSPLDVADLLQSTLRLAQNEMALGNTTYILDVPEDLFPLRGVANQLRHVFLNLFLNAIQAMPAGGVLTVVARASGTDAVEVRVIDHGVGIPPDVLPHIFEPFFTTKGPGKGTGLGLWVAYSIVKGHGGSIRAESTPGQGTTFRVLIPAARRA